MDIHTKQKNSIYADVSNRTTTFLNTLTTDEWNMSDTPTVFPAFMVLDSLSDIPGFDEIKEQLKVFLLKQLHPQTMSVNWWQRGSDPHTNEPYPDDLDDTSCTLAALQRSFPHTVSPHVLAQFTKTLIASEHAEGGPYVTWITPKTMKNRKVWTDVDPVVNCNIAYFLSLQQIYLPKHIDFIRSAFSKKFVSPYYPSIFPVIYFFSRFYKNYAAYVEKKGEENILLATKRLALKTLLNACADPQPLHTQDCALSLLSFSFLNELHHPILLKLVENIHRTRSWSPGELCIHTNKGGVVKTTGSSYVTAALCLQAMYIRTHSHNKNEEETKQQNVCTAIYETMAKELETLPLGIRSQITQTFEKLKTSKNFVATIMFPFMLAQTVPQLWIPKEKQLMNACGAIYGWMGYTICDDIVDGDCVTQEWISSMNLCNRKAYACFLSCAGDVSWFESHMQSYLMEMDEALACSLSKKITDLEQHLNLSWKKSLGCFIPIISALSHFPKKKRGVYMHGFLEFFKNFIIAKQLSDDAHDWEEDHSLDRDTYVTTLLKSHANGSKTLQEVFWTTTIYCICEKIKQHILLSRKALQKMHLHNTAVWETFLLPVEHMAYETIEEAKHTKDFLSSYTKNGMLNGDESGNHATSTTRNNTKRSSKS